MEKTIEVNFARKWLMSSTTVTRTRFPHTSTAPPVCTGNHDNDNRISERMSTRYSDDNYPWPAGMTPWLIEREGCGIIPDGARSNFGKKMP